MLQDVVIGNKTYAKLCITDFSTLDEIAMKVIRQDPPEFLLPMKAIDIDGELEIRYEIGEGNRLSYLPDKMSRNELMMLLANMMKPFKECNDWFLNYHNFCIDMNYIIVGKNYQSVKYVYIPDDAYEQTEEAIINFFGDYILSVNLTDDPSLVVNLYRRLKGATIASFYDYIVREMGQGGKSEPAPAAQSAPSNNMGNFASGVAAGMNAAASIFEKVQESVESVVKKPAPTPAPTPTPAMPAEEKKPEPAAPTEFGQDDVKVSLINNLFGDDDEDDGKKNKKAKKEKPVKEKSVKEKPAKSGGWLESMFGGKAEKEADVAPQSQPAPAQQMNAKASREPVQSYIAPQPQNPSFFVEEDVTVLSSNVPIASGGNILKLELESDGGYHFPKFIEVDLSKGNATIGRNDKSGNAQSDYNFDASFSFISRRHLRVELQNGQFRVIDLGSGNGSMLNSEIMVPNMPYPLNRGDRIVLSKTHRITYRVC